VRTLFLKLSGRRSAGRPTMLERGNTLKGPINEGSLREDRSTGSHEKGVGSP